MAALGNPEGPHWLSAMSDEAQPLIEAATFLDRTIRVFLTQDGSLQAETWIVAVARMAGTLILRNHLPLGAAEPGAPLLSAAADQEGPRLVRLLLLTLNHLGLDLAESAIEVPPGGTGCAQLSLAATRERLEPLVMACGRSHGLGLGETADALMITTALAIHTCQGVLSINRGAGLAVAGLVEGAKTMPAAPGALATSQP